MKKYFFNELALISLIALTTSCSSGKKDTRKKIITEAKVNNVYRYAIGLGETINFSSNAWQNDEKIKTLLDENQDLYSGEYTLDDTYDGFEIKMNSFDSFSIKCIKEFDKKLDIDSITFSNDKYVFTMPIDIELTFNNKYFDRDSFETSFLKVSSIDDVVCYLSISPILYRYSNSDIYKIKNISVDNEMLKLKGQEVSSYKASTSSVSYGALEYSELELPYSCPITSHITFLKLSFEKMVSGYECGGDVKFDIEVNGDTQTYTLHCPFKTLVF